MSKKFIINTDPGTKGREDINQIKGDYPKAIPNKFIIEQTGAIVQAFGLSHLKTELYRAGMPKASFTKDISPILRKSKLGNAIFSDLAFDAITLPNGEAIKHIPVDIALFTVNRNKNIVVTPISGRDEDVIEYLSKKSFTINIKGIINGDNGRYPQEEVESLIKYLEANVALPITSFYLNSLFSVYNVVVTDYSLAQDEGFYSRQKFEINCISDAPVELKIQQSTLKFK